MDTVKNIMSNWGPALVGGLMLILVIALGAAAQNAHTELEQNPTNADAKIKYNGLVAATVVFGLLMAGAFALQVFMLIKKHRSSRMMANAMFDTPSLSNLDSTF